MRLLASLLLFAFAFSAAAEVPANLVVENIPEFPATVVEKIRPYLDFRTATFMDWNPARPEMLVRTRFAETPQVHLVKMPGGDRRQLTFYDDAVGGATFRPRHPDTILFTKDIGGNEFFQFYRLDLKSGAVALLTDGKSRNLPGAWSRDGKWLAYSSTKRNANDTDIWIMDVSSPDSARMVLQVEGGGWSASDFSKDGKTLLVTNFKSANDTDLYVLDIATGTKTLLTPKAQGAPAVYYSGATFSADDSEIFFTTDEGSEFQQLIRMRLSDKSRQTVVKEKWDVDSFALSEDRTRLAYELNENGASALHLRDLTTGKALPAPKLPMGTIGGLAWHPSNRYLGFSITSAKSPSDAYSVDTTTGELTRWTHSETGGLSTDMNAEPELITMKSFDGLPISSFLYRPDPKRFPGKRPVLIIAHGGPEGQSRPTFQGRSNFYVNELGLAVAYPNVRGSTGYGKTFLAADNGFKREDSVRDIGALLDYIAADPRLDAQRVAIYGGSYGGYMVLASMIHFPDRIRAGIDVVGISSFLTFLKNTSGYRRDLRRVEYGDERDPKMYAHLEKISPLANAAKIRQPLFVIMGFNDPRVPYTEGEQITKQVRANGAPVWYLMAKDEGHGFAKRKNQDFQLISMVLFLQQYLLNEPASGAPEATSSRP